MPPPFVPGVELSRRLYREAVRPLLDREFPGLPHTAALIGPGSEVLGFDTPRSTDHDWGPRLQVFLSAEDVAGHGLRMSGVLADGLPPEIAGWSTHLPSNGNGGRLMRPARGRVEHGVEIAEPGAWLTGRLGFDPRAGVTTRDWLCTPAQALAEIVGGAVFHDGLGELDPVRERLAWYPDAVWRYLLACQWRRIGQEEPFVGRCGEVGDELGSAVTAARLVRDVMRLCLLLARVHPPYGKWLGSAFARLPDAPRLTPMLTAAVTATGWRDREHHLIGACEVVAALQNETGLTEPLDPSGRPFFDRPFRVLGADRFADALMATVRDPELRDLPWIGAVDQFVDSTDALGDRRVTRAAGSARWRERG